MGEQLVLEFTRAAQATDPYAFQFSPQTYLLRTRGGGVESAVFAWTEKFLAELNGAWRPGCDPAVIQSLGDTLRQFVAPAWAEYEAQILQSEQAGRTTLLTIRSTAAELYALPWELLTLKSTGQHVGGLPHVQLRYEWPETRTTGESPAPRRETGRILFAWSAAAGAVPAAAHISALRTCCAAGAVAFDPQTDVLANTSCAGLLAALAAARTQGQGIAVLHLLCHGSASGSTFGLAFDSDQSTGELVIVDAGRLRQLLGPYADMIRLVVLSACDSGNSGTLGNRLGSVAQALHRAGFGAVIASRYPLAVAASIRLAEVFYHELLVENRSLEDSLRMARQHLASDAAHLDWASLQLYSRFDDGDDSRPVLFRPYRGLLSFSPADSRFFFGRQREVEEVIAAYAALVKNNKTRFLVVAGASGSGKSSLVLAGVVPRLLAAAGGSLQLAVIRPGSEPQKALAAALASAAPGPGGGRTLLIVDQFEEIFTHVADAATREELVRRLWRLASDPEAGVFVLVTLRVDFLGECGAVVIDEAGRRLDVVAYDQEHRVFIPWLATDQLRAAIEGPAQRVGIKLEAGLTSRMLEAVGAEPGALPLLSYTLDLLWLRREGRTLTQAGYEAVGQVVGALSQHADTLIGQMSAAEQQLAQHLFVRLVHLGDGVAHNSRQRVPIARLRPRTETAWPLFDHVAQSLTAARLLLHGEEGLEPSLEVAHEALIRSWPQLQKWLNQDRELLAQLKELEALLVQWREHKALLSGDQLRFVKSFAKAHPEEFSAEAQALLRASRRQAVQILWFQRLLAVTLLSLTLLFGYLYYLERSTHHAVQAAQQRMDQQLSQPGHDASVAEIMRILAWLRLELGGTANDAAAFIDKALELEPHNPHLLVDRAEFLLAKKQLAAVQQAAEQALATGSEKGPRLRLFLIAWSAAHLQGPEARAQDAAWAGRLLHEYELLPDGVPLNEADGESLQIILNRHFLQVGLPRVEILRVYRLLRANKSAATLQQLGQRLQVPQ